MLFTKSINYVYYFFLYLISLQTKFPLVAIFFNPNQIIGPQVKPLNIVKLKINFQHEFSSIYLPWSIFTG